MAKKAKKRLRRGPVILPSKMSALIKIALRDIRKVEASDEYMIDMGIWHQPKHLFTKLGEEVLCERPVCVVCAAGSVMAMTLKANVNLALETDQFPKNQNQLQALDYLRSGSVSGAAQKLNISYYVNEYDPKPPKGMKDSKVFEKLDCVVPEYDRKDPEPFHKAMTKLQARLQKAGL